LRFYTRILVWENRRRLERLSEFRNLVLAYFENSEAHWMAEERTERPDAQSARVRINRAMDEMRSIILCAGVRPAIRWSPPPAVGGYVQNVDLVQNLFNLHRFRIPPNHVLDFIDQAIGIYEANARPAFLRTINPLFYLGQLFDWVAGLPFALLGRLGFSRSKAEESRLGRLIKGVLYLVTVAASALTILQLLGYLDSAKAFVRQLAGSN
jgi:hypothetical protein